MPYGFRARHLLFPSLLMHGILSRYLFDVPDHPYLIDILKYVRKSSTAERMIHCWGRGALRIVAHDDSNNPDHGKRQRTNSRQSAAMHVSRGSHKERITKRIIPLRRLSTAGTLRQGGGPCVRSYGWTTRSQVSDLFHS